MASQRLFFAIEIPEAVQDQILAIQKPVEAVGTDLYRFVGRENLHLTLLFLGQVEEEQKVEFCARARREFSGPITLKLDGLLRLPEPTVPKILCANLGGELAKLRQMQQALLDRMWTLMDGSEIKPFVPHITFARLKRGVPPSAKPVKRAISAIPGIVSNSFVVEEFQLMASELSEGHPVYSVIEKFRL